MKADEWIVKRETSKSNYPSNLSLFGVMYTSTENYDNDYGCE